MRALYKKLRRSIPEMLGLYNMDDRFQVLAANYVFVMFYYTLESVFINTLLYRISPEMSIVIGYRMQVYLYAAIAMNASAYLSKRFSPVTVLRLGAMFYALMYGLLFVGLEYMSWLRFPVAFFSGLGYGFYFGGHNVLINSYSCRRNRGLGVSIMGAIQGAMTLMAPLVSGFVIAILPGNIGYRIMFGIGMLTVLAQTGMQKRLAGVEQNRESEYALALKLLMRKTTCKLMMGYECLRGLRDGIFTFFLSMVLFEIVTNEGLVGINTFLTGIMAIMGSWAYGKLSGPGKRVSYGMLATTVLLLGCLGLLRFLNVFTIMLFSAINAFGSLFIVYTTNTYSFDVMGQNDTMRSCLAEMGALREIALSTGRILGMLLVLQFPHTLTGYVQAMCVLTASQYVCIFLVKLTKDIMDRKHIYRITKEY